MEENISVNLQEAKTLTLLVYILQAVGFLSIGLAWVAGVIVNHIKQDAVRGSWYASHFRWQMRTFWFSVLWFVVCAPLWLLVFPGWLAYSVIVVWALYRIVRGWVNFNDGRPMYVK